MTNPDITFAPQQSSVLAGLPEWLKDPANYEDVEKQIIQTFVSTCAHSEIMDWANCPKCTKKMLERRKLLKRLGFKNPAQYLAWKKTHQAIKERYPLVDWKAQKKINLKP